MLHPRHQAREVALQLLYQFDFSIWEPERLVSPEFVAHLQAHFDHFQIHPELRAFASQLIVGTLSKKETLDALLGRHLQHWKLSRITPVDRALLRMSLYEMLSFPETPHPVVLDEAVELAKLFGSEETPGFVNGVLDAIRKSQNEQFLEAIESKKQGVPTE